MRLIELNPIYQQDCRYCYDINKIVEGAYNLQIRPKGHKYDESARRSLASQYSSKTIAKLYLTMGTGSNILIVWPGGDSIEASLGCKFSRC